jgi:hypothetical protein
MPTDPNEIERLAEKAIAHASLYSTGEGDPRRKFTMAQMEIAIAYTLKAKEQSGE